jgi:hypothetical protein
MADPVIENASIPVNLIALCTVQMQKIPVKVLLHSIGVIQCGTAA